MNLIMEYLISLGLSDDEIKEMSNLNKNIFKNNVRDIKNNIEVLKKIGCRDNIIKSIIITNPNYLNIRRENVMDLIQMLTSYNVSSLNLLFYTNPFLLNKEAYEIRGYFRKQESLGKIREVLADEISINPYIMDEK